MKYTTGQNCKKRLKKICSFDISEKELSELIELDNFNPYFDHDEYEYCGNYILTDNKEEWLNSIDNMCCGILKREYDLGVKKVYFAFDYGH